jgi:hypothetical protein
MTIDKITSSSSFDRERLSIEALMDEILTESFPASDPPAWGSAARRIRRAEAREMSAVEQPGLTRPVTHDKPSSSKKRRE